MGLQATVLEAIRKAAVRTGALALVWLAAPLSAQEAVAGGLGFYGVAGGDLDGDGRGDLVLTGPHGLEMRMGGRGGAIVLAADGVRSSAVGDLDGDGRAEVMALVGREVRLWSREGTSWEERSVHRLDGQGLHLACGDTDGDGTAEIAAAFGLSRPGAEVRPSRVFLLRRIRGQWVPGAQVDFARHIGAMCMGDVDGDGRAELTVELGGEEVGGYIETYTFTDGSARLLHGEQLGNGGRVLQLSTVGGLLGAVDGGRLTLWGWEGESWARRRGAASAPIRGLLLWRPLVGNDIEIVGAVPAGIWRLDGAGF